MGVQTQRTLFGMDLQLAQMFGKEYIITPNTTLNEKFNIQIVDKPLGVYPTLKYITIGTGADTKFNSISGYPYSNHSPLDGALFNHIPFVMKTLDNDLDLSERNKYRFRKEETHNGTLYACYYLKVIEEVLYDNKFYRINTVNNETYLKQMNINIPDILHPRPKDRDINYSTLENTEFITKLGKFKFTLDPDELKNLKEVKNILGNNKIVSELGLCTGIDVGEGTEVEAICVQIAYHIDMNLDMTYDFHKEETFTKFIELGGAEPLII